jgi:NAD(P)-dependent dehydrogenase (short-subunit alcohol dehydrogenase family)
MLTVQYAKSHPGITFNPLEPGTTATDMTAAFGVGRPVTESAKTVVRLATLGPDGPSGTFTDEFGHVSSSPSPPPSPHTPPGEVDPGHRKSSRMTTRGNPASTEVVSAAFTKPACSKTARVPT